MVIEQTKTELLDMLSKSEAFLSFSDSLKLKQLSDRAIRDAAVRQDPDTLQLAVVVYALSKIIERGAANLAPFSDLFAQAKAKLELDRDEEYRADIARVLDRIAHEDTRLGLYVDQVITQAKIKKGSTLFAGGLSLGQSAHLLGISKWELMHYVGRTSLTEEMPALDVLTRLSFARRLFKK